MEYARIASAIPGTNRSATSRVASGVTSRGERPVPPVVKITSAALLSQIARSLSANSALSSGKRWYSEISPRDFVMRSITSLLSSDLRPAAPLSDAVTMAILNLISDIKLCKHFVSELQYAFCAVLYRNIFFYRFISCNQLYYAASQCLRTYYNADRNAE